jgi:hypothetical protein
MDKSIGYLSDSEDSTNKTIIFPKCRERHCVLYFPKFYDLHLNLTRIMNDTKITLMAIGLPHRQLNYSKTSHCYPIFGNTIPARREQLAELIL